jgi:hypothetical protein
MSELNFQHKILENNLWNEWIVYAYNRARYVICVLENMFKIIYVL